MGLLTIAAPTTYNKTGQQQSIDEDLKALPTHRRE
jgi:hypothetical protein